MRVVAYDINSRQDLGVIVEVLTRLNADVVGMMSVPTSRELRAIARATGLEIACRAPTRGATSAVLVGAGVRVRSTSILPLATSRGTTNRAAAHAIVGVAGTSVSVTAIDFGLRTDVRARNQQALREFLAPIEPATVIAASLHAAASPATLAGMGGDLQDAFAVAGSGTGDTFPAADPVARHDVVLVDRRLQIVACHVDRGDHAETAARHRAVVAELEPIERAEAAPLDAR